VLGAGCWVLGSQIRRSYKSIKDTLSEGYGKRRYKAELIKFLVYAYSSCDETQVHLDMLIIQYQDISDFQLLSEDKILGRRINSYIDYVDYNWRTS
jgi:four helix bundle protein